MAAFDVEANSMLGLQSKNLHRSLRQKVFWRCSCTGGRKHLQYLQPDTVWKRWQRDGDSLELECLICSGSRNLNQPMSDHEEAARQAAGLVRNSYPRPTFWWR